MKRTVQFFIVLLAMAIGLTACGGAENKGPYSIEAGAYGFDKAVITNIITKEETEKVFDDILQDSDWRWLLSFSVGISEDTTFRYNNDTDSYFTLDGGNAYELVGDNTLKLHFPRWEGYDYGIYSVTIILGKHKLYG